jgi:hypothetical protein
MQQVCRSAPDLDVLVLNEPVAGVAGRSWRSPAWKQVTTAHGRQKIDRFYVYQCTGLR